MAEFAAFDWRDPFRLEDQLSGEERAKIDSAVAAAKEAIAGSDYRLIRKKMDELNQATQHLAEVMMNSAVNTVLQGKKLADF